jgi:VCBS repeat-containing protein
MITFRVGDISLNMGSSDFNSFVLNPALVGNDVLGANILNLVDSVGVTVTPAFESSEHWVFTSAVTGQKIHFYGQSMTTSNAPVTELTVTDGTGLAEIFGFVLTDPMELNATEMINWDVEQTLAFFTDVFAGESITVQDGSFGNTINGSAEADTLNGGGGNDRLGGLDGADVIDGGTGNDTLNGGAGADSILGGIGNDTFTDQSGNDTLNGGAGSDLFAGKYTGSASIVVTGGSGSDTYMPGSAAIGGFRVTDFTIGGAERDKIDVGALLDASARAGFFTGQDPVAGGFIKQVISGDDKLVRWDLDGAGAAHSPFTLMTLAGLGNVALTTQNLVGFLPGATAAANNLTGGSGNDILLGLGGNDTLTGAAGNDHLFGGAGADSMRGGAGSDTYQVDNAGDKVVETSNTGSLVLTGSGAGSAGASAIDTVISSINFSVGALQFVENIVLTGFASRATGNGLANVLTGNAGSDSLTGGNGNDTLDGGAGNDTLDGGAGNDLLVGGAGSDVLKGGLGNDTYVAGDSISDTGGTDTVRSSLATYTLAPGLENLVLIGGGVNGAGNGIANSITGNSAVNRLTGAGGNDTLNGGGGADSLLGGEGNDTLRWDVADVLVDGGDGTDTLLVSEDGVSVDLRETAGSVIKQIEVINFLGTGVDSFLTLDAESVGAINATDLLTIDGSGGTVVLGGSWTNDASDANYDYYASGDLVLKISTDLLVDLPNVAPEIVSESAPSALTEGEAGVDLVASGQIEFSDPDVDDFQSGQFVADVANALGGNFSFDVTAPASGSNTGMAEWNYTLANGNIQWLGEGATASETFTISVYDMEDGSDEATVTITVTGINDAPEVTVASEQEATLSEDLLISGLSVFDVDMGDVLEVTLSADLGTLSLTEITGLTFTSGDGDGDASMEFEGSLLSLNAALASLVYHAPESGEVAVITLSSTDGLLTATDSFDVLILS